MFGGGTMDPKRRSVHRVLAHSYFTTLGFFLLGAALDIFFGWKIMDEEIIGPAGLGFLVAGTALVFWAQYSSHKFVKENITSDSFRRGPYRFTRNPTHWGLFLVLLGFGLAWNALFVIIFTVISLFVTKTIFLKQEEAILAEKYGAPYLEYKQATRL